MPALLEVRDLRLTFDTPVGPSSVLRGVNLSVDAGKIAGLVGESGCGKSLTGRSIIGLLPANATVSGRVLFDNVDLLTIPREAVRRLRGARIAMVFQDPAAALNPLFTIGEQVTRIIKVREREGVPDVAGRARELLAEVGLGDAERLMRKYPHQLSGGMQQRVMIAMALAGSPELLIADEPTTALDVTIQAQLLVLLRALCRDRGIGVLLITHNMAVVRQACDDVNVLYAGQVVESGPVGSILSTPLHPYTQALLAAVPSPAQANTRLQVIPGRVPRGDEPLQACVFVDRCTYAVDASHHSRPPIVTGGDGHSVACWLHVDPSDRPVGDSRVLA